MKASHLLSSVFLFFISAFSVNAATINYNFVGTVTDAGNIGGVSASLDDQIIGNFAYDTLTPDENSDPTIGVYHSATLPSLKITLPSGSLTFDIGTGVRVVVDTSINISAGLPDPTTPGNLIDIDIIFSSLAPTDLRACPLPPPAVGLPSRLSGRIGGSFPSRVPRKSGGRSIV